MARPSEGKESRTGSRQDQDVLLAALREAALRSVWRVHQDGGQSDVNPHTTEVGTYSTASMLTFSADSSPIDVGDVTTGLAWTMWELERLGYTNTAARLADLDRTHGGTQAL